MKIISKFLLSIITLIIFSFLFFATFLLKNDNLVENFQYKKIEKWRFEINKLDNNNYSLNKINEIKKDAILLENISDTSRFFLVNWNYTLTNSWSNIIINIDPWIYLFELNDINNNIIIESNWYRINKFSNWKFFINTLNPLKNLFFSIDSIINVEVLDINNKKLLTNLILYPHHYFISNPEKNYRIKWWNILRINQILNFQFFKEKIFSQANEINEKYLNLLSIKNDADKNIIKDIFMFVNNDYINNLNNWLNNLYILPWENLIKTYFYLFFNDEKKKIYYKNLILKNILWLINSNNINDEKINFIVTNIKTIEKLDSKLVDELMNIISYIYITKVNSKEISVTSNIIFYNLLSKIQKIDYKNKKLNSILILKKIFINYDHEEKYNLFKDIFLFKEQYFKDNWLDKKDWDKSKIDYLLFFMENIININLINKEIYIDKMIILFNDYVWILSKYSDITDEKNNRTNVYKVKNILKKLWETIKSTYFENERNKSNLLIRKKEIESLETLNNIITNLNLFINPIINKFENNKDNEILINEYLSNIETYKEYVIALEDYEKYKSKYDKDITALINWNVNFNNSTDSNITTNEELRKYLNWFFWLNTSNLKIEKKDYNYCKNWESISNFNEPGFIMECFSVYDIYLTKNLKPIPFLLFPFEENKIEIKVEINDTIKTKSFKLNIIEEWLEEKLKGSTNTEDIEKYDFKKFFVNNFSKEEIKIWNPIIETIKPKITEEKYIRFFKWNLLSDKWDFSLLKWFLDIKYNDLLIEKVEEKYLITIKNALINTNLKIWNTDLKFKSILNSNYIFQDSHSFENINLKIIDPYDKEEKNYILWWNFINITEKINIGSLEKTINRLFIQINDIKNIYNTLKNILYKNEVDIKYYPEKDYFKINIEYKNKKLSIILNSWYITSINYNWKDIIKSQIQILELKNILNTIL